MKQNQAGMRRIHPSKLIQLCLFTLTLLVVLLLLILNLNLNRASTKQVPTNSETATVTETSPNASAPKTTATTTSTTPAATHLQFTTLSLKKGQSVSVLFEKLKIPANVLTHLLKNPIAARAFRKLAVGSPIQFGFDTTHQLRQIQLNLPDHKTLTLSRQANDAWILGSAVQMPIQKQTVTPVTTPTPTPAPATKTTTAAPVINANLIYRSGVIHFSLSRAVANAGLGPNFTTQLVAIFGQKINFSRQIHPGDHFSLLYDYDPKTKTNHIEIAQFVVGKQTYTAIRYTDLQGRTNYYTPAGDSLQPGMIRYPLNFERISSPFSYRRLDPVLHVYRAHLGVDLAAPNGTAVKSIGDGTVEFVGQERGYGNVVKIRYNRHLESLYAHLSRFAPHLHRYQAVSKGQVVGYVGTTGYSTGPHLHFELHVNGVPENPLRVPLPSAASVPASQRAHFKAIANALQQQLAAHQATA